MERAKGTEDEAQKDEGGEADEVTVIVAAVAWTTDASKVIDAATRLARRNWPNSQLHIVHVFRSGIFDRPGRGGTRQDELLDEAKSYLEHHVRMARRQCPAPVTGHFAVGDPSDEIVRVSASMNADLVVIGTEDSVGLERFLLGSIAETIVKKAPCSVMVVRPKERRLKKV